MRCEFSEPKNRSAPPEHLNVSNGSRIGWRRRNERSVRRRRRVAHSLVSLEARGYAELALPGLQRKPLLGSGDLEGF